MARLLIATVLLVCISYVSAETWSSWRLRDECDCRRGRGIEVYRRECITLDCERPYEERELPCECGPFPDFTPGEIAGIAVGSVGGLFLIILLICWMCCCCGCCQMEDCMGCMGCGCREPDVDPYGGTVMRGPVINQIQGQPQQVIVRPQIRAPAQQTQAVNFCQGIQAQPPQTITCYVG